jgi:hypothetical protein
VPDTRDLLRTLFSALGLLFPIWPLVLLPALQRRRHILLYMTFGWAAMLLFWLGAVTADPPQRSWLIPDPWNTLLFFATGLALLGALFGRRLWQRLKFWQVARRAARIDALRALSPSEFEELVVELYGVLGHHARRTGGAGDHGIDVVVRAANGERWLVQCKRWRGNVGEPVVRDLYGVLHHEKAERGVILTTGVFTDQARAWARGKPIDLIDGDQLLRLLRQLRRPRSPRPRFETTRPAPPCLSDREIAAD